MMYNFSRAVLSFKEVRMALWLTPCHNRQKCCNVAGMVACWASWFVATYVTARGGGEGTTTVSLSSSLPYFFALLHKLP